MHFNFFALHPQTQRQIILFLIVGFINTIFGYLCFAFFYTLGLHYAVAAFLATCCGILFNFNTTGKIVFKNKRKVLIFKFIGVYLFLFCLNVSSLKALQYFSTNYYLTEFVTIIPLAVVAFLLNKFVVFKEKYDVVVMDQLHIKHS